MTVRGPLDDPGWLRREYEAGRSTTDIAMALGCGSNTVLRRLRSYGISIRPPASVDPKPPPARVKEGERYGRLVVLYEEGRRNRERTFRCVCDCGTQVVVRGASLRNRRTRSCGCLRTELSAGRVRTHGLSSHPLYRAFKTMHQRCSNPDFPKWKDYGKRGIVVCERWTGPDGFPNFLADMGERPLGRTLDRIDNDGPYAPDNCRWATPLQQSANSSPKGSRPPA